MSTAIAQRFIWFSRHRRLNSYVTLPQMVVRCVSGEWYVLCMCCVYGVYLIDARCGCLLTGGQSAMRPFLLSTPFVELIFHSFARERCPNPYVLFCGFYLFAKSVCERGVF